MKEIVKKMVLGTSNACFTSHLAQQTSQLAYHIVDCQISNVMPAFTLLPKPEINQDGNDEQQILKDCVVLATDEWYFFSDNLISDSQSSCLFSFSK